MRATSGRTGALTLVCVVVVSLLVWMPAGPAAAAGPYSSYAISGDTDDTIVGNAGYTGTTVGLDGDDKSISGGLGGWILSIAAPPSERLQAGRSYDITGVPGSAPGAALSLSGGQGQYCGNEVGTFTIRELTLGPDARLSTLVVTFTLQCAGASGHAYGSVALRASTPAPPVPPALRLKLATKRVDYNTALDAEARVIAGVPRTVVSLYRRTDGGAEELLTRAAANDEGVVATSFRVVENTTVLARIQSGGAYPDRVVSQSVPVNGELKAKVLSKGPTRGGAHLIPATRDASVGAVLLPDHRGDCIKFRLELRVRGTWGYQSATKCLRLNDHSAVSVRVPGDRRLIGIPIRVRAQWKGDDRNKPTKSHWVYLRFVR